MSFGEPDDPVRIAKWPTYNFNLKSRAWSYLWQASPDIQKSENPLEIQRVQRITEWFKVLHPPINSLGALVGFGGGTPNTYAPPRERGVNSSTSRGGSERTNWCWCSLKTLLTSFGRRHPKARVFTGGPRDLSKHTGCLDQTAALPTNLLILTGGPHPAGNVRSEYGRRALRTRARQAFSRTLFWWTRVEPESSGRKLSAGSWLEESQLFLGWGIPNNVG